MLIIDHKFIVKISLLSLKIPVLIFRLTRTISNMRIAKIKKRILFINTQSPEIYVPQLEAISLMFKISIIYQHITYGEVAGYSLGTAILSCVGSGAAYLLKAGVPGCE